MRFFGHGLAQAWHLIITGDPYLMHLTWISLKVATIPTAFAALIAIPLGLTLGVGRFRGRGTLLVLANTGLGLPPVVVGVVLLLAMFPKGPLGWTHLLFTLHGVYLAQAILAFPVLLAFTASAVRALPPGLFDQARAFGANRPQLGVLALREARIGVMAALIAAIGGGLSEVGAVVLVGANLIGVDQTLASASLEETEAGDYARAFAIGIILIGLTMLISALLTALQYLSGLSPTLRRGAS